MSNIITAVFSGCNPTFAAATPMSWQWDTGQILKIEGLKLHTGVQAHFIVGGESITQIIGVSGGCGYVTVPNTVFQSAGACMVYLYISEDDDTAETEYSILITILERVQPEDYSDPTPAEETLFQAAIDAVEAAQEAADAAAALAESWAVGGTGTRAGEDFNNSKFWAEMAAEQAAEGGFVYFEIRYPGYLMMTRSDNLDDDIDFALTDQGDLEVTLR
jgi:hypothetical protein